MPDLKKLIGLQRFERRFGKSKHIHRLSKRVKNLQDIPALLEPIGNRCDIPLVKVMLGYVLCKSDLAV